MFVFCFVLSMAWTMFLHVMDNCFTYFLCHGLFYVIENVFVLRNQQIVFCFFYVIAKCLSIIFYVIAKRLSMSWTDVFVRR